MKVRIQKAIADAGICSRRKAEDLINVGKVLLNGKVVREHGTKVDPNKDVISVDGRLVDPQTVEKMYLVMHKPRGYVTTVKDPEGRRTVMDLCNEINERIYPIGRLDYLSEGLLILTNDGDLANQIMHPSFEIEKVYEVKVFGSVSQTLLQTMRDGVTVDGQFLKPRSVRVLKQLPTKTWLEFRLNEGKNREIRKMCEACNVVVDKLKRLAIGGLTVEGIAPGKYRSVTKRDLLNRIGMNEDGTKKRDMVFVSAKKSLKLNKRKSTPSTKQAEITPAEHSVFKLFRKDVYYENLNLIKENQKIKKEKELQKIFDEKEEFHKAKRERKEIKNNPELAEELKPKRRVRKPFGVTKKVGSKTPFKSGGKTMSRGKPRSSSKPGARKKF